MPTCAELRLRLAALGLSTSGNKSELEERLQVANLAAESTQVPANNNLIVGANGIAAHPNAKKYTGAILSKNVLASTRTSYLSKQKRMGTWALTQPNLKDHVNGGVITGDGLKMMANDPNYFLTFITWLTFPEGNIPAEFDDGMTLKAHGIETLAAYRKSLHKQFEENCIQKSKNYESVIKTLFSGFARNDAKRRQETGLTTGKDAMNAVYYKAVAQAALCWSNSTGSILLLHLFSSTHLIQLDRYVKFFGRFVLLTWKNSCF